MPYFMRKISDNTHQIWEANDAVVYRMGVTNPESGPDYFKADPDKTAMETLTQKVPAWFLPGKEQFTQTILSPGQYYPRIARPSAHHPSDFPKLSMQQYGDGDFVAIARSQLTTLMRQLELICQTIHPCAGTFRTFGHSIRNLLILACTEVETHWRGILTANHYASDQYKTTDYVLLQQAMRLGDYAINFPAFPWLDSLRPFEGWEKTAPTKTLAWYSAYNAVKHNRELEFENATLLSVLNAVSACAIMMVAQFGTIIGLGRNTELDAFFHLSSWPKWTLADVYLPSFDAVADRSLQIDYPFSK
jgi:hypothetical protein